tara:strand:+ start:1437 stop:2480 length:1044 start_codon:yes stop_codon:yes gene_type:complete
LPETSINLEDLANRYGCELIGDPMLLITEVAGLDKASKNSISFLANDKYKSLLKETNAGAVIIKRDDLKDCQSSALITEDPYLIFARIASYFEKSRDFEEGFHPSSIIEDTAEVPSNCSIQAGAYIGKGVKLGQSVFIGSNSVISANCFIDSHSWIDPGVIILSESSIGNRAIIHSGVVIGADGFGFSEDEEQNWVKVPQTGSVIIGDDVEIGANTTIDRGTISDTQIHNGVKLDNLIQIGHNVVIGEHTAIVACTAIAGSSVIGKHCKISGQVGITGHIEIADGTTITGRTSVMKSIKKAGVYSSSLFPHQEASLWQKNVAIFRNLPKLKSIISKIRAEDEDDSDS